MDFRLSSKSLILLLFSLVLLIVAYFQAINRLIVHDWSRADFDYCYLIPFVVAYLIWEKRSQFARLASRSSWLGLIPVFFGIFFFLLGEFGGEFLSLYLSLWFMILGLCWIQFGWKKLKVILFPICFILTMFPPPSFFYSRITLNMQLISTKLGIHFLHLFQVPAYREGNVIDLGFTQLQIVQACSGLRFLIPLLILSILLVYYFRESWWKRGLVLLLAFPLSILMNGLRLAALALLTIWLKDPGLAETWVHDALGWAMFVVSLGILLGVMQVLKGLPPKTMETPPSTQEAESGPNPGPDRNKRAVSAPYILALVLILGTFAFVYYRANTSDIYPKAKNLAQFPKSLGTWQGEDYPLSERLLKALDLTDYYQADYRNGQGDLVQFYVAWYETQAKGESIHSPETCLRGGGWQFQKSGATKLKISEYQASPLRANQALLSRPGEKMLTYFWFWCRGRNLVNGYELKLYNMWDRLTKRRTDGALIRVMTPIQPGKGVSQAKARIQSFLSQALPELEKYLPYGS